MKIGTLILEIFGDLPTKQSIDIIKNTMHQLLKSVSEDYDFDYRRFEYLSAKAIWVIPLTVLYKTDHVYKALVRTIDNNLYNWELEITLLIHSKQL